MNKAERGEHPRGIGVGEALAKVKRTGNPVFLDPTESSQSIPEKARQRRGRPFVPGERFRQADFTVVRRDNNNGSDPVISFSFGDYTTRAPDPLVDLEGLSPVDVEALCDLGAKKVDATVEVVSRPPVSHTKHGSIDTSVRIVSINGIQKPFDGDTAQLIPDENFPETPKNNLLIQGDVEAYLDDPDEGRSIMIKLGNGKMVSVVLEGGYYANLIGDVIELDHFNAEALLGEKIQFNATYERPEGRSGGHRLQFESKGKPYLLEPIPKRKEAHDAQREIIAEGFSRITAEIGTTEIRQSITELVKANAEKKSELGIVPFTFAEKAALRKITREKIPEVSERPLDLVHAMDASMARIVGELYGVDINSMSRKEYYDFCMKVAKGQTERSTDRIYDFFALMNHALPQSQQEEILLKAFHHLHPDGEENTDKKFLESTLYQLAKQSSSSESAQAISKVVMAKVISYQEGRQEDIRSLLEILNTHIGNLTHKVHSSFEVIHPDAAQEYVVLLPQLEEFVAGLDDWGRRHFHGVLLDTVDNIQVMKTNLEK